MVLRLLDHRAPLVRERVVARSRKRRSDLGVDLGLSRAVRGLGAAITALEHSVPRALDPSRGPRALERRDGVLLVQCVEDARGDGLGARRA